MSQSLHKAIGKRIADRYSITGEIGRGGMGVVFLALPFDDPSNEVAIKVVRRRERLGYEDLLRFQKEASLMSQLYHPNIIAFHELGLFDAGPEEEAGYFIVMEYANGQNLKESLLRDGRKDLPFFFQLGLQVSSALDYTHGKNIIHRDIKPQNLIVTKAWRDQRGVMIKVLDFGVARLAESLNATGKEMNQKGTVDDFAGTPLYMAPEQSSGNFNRIDHRVDLYSLGCVFYEVLTGQPPFSGSSREQIEKLHQTTEPERIRNLRPDVPEIVEQIVHKLLEKNPDNRYQTAFSLHADLMQAKKLFDHNPRKIPNFQISTKDKFYAVSALLPMKGRDEELASIISDYEQTCTPQGRSRMAVIRGAAGMGKTRILAEFRSYLVKKRIRFISGSFAQHENTLPFNALANAFNEYLIRILKTQPVEAENLKQRIKTIVGPSAHQIAEVVPGLEPFTEDIPYENVDGEIDQDNFKNFAKAFSDFTRCLPGEEQPIVFILDDLQWADDRSVELIDQFFSNANTQKFLFVITLRSGQKLPQKINQFLEKFSKLKRRYREVDLKPLSAPALTQMTADLLNTNTMTYELVEQLLLQSQGNPMVLVETLRSFILSGIVTNTDSTLTWRFSQNGPEKNDLISTSIDLALSRINRYEGETRDILELAAAAGFLFQFELFTAARFERAVVTQTIDQLVREGLIHRIPDDPAAKHLGKSYSFTHKKVRDTIYENIVPEKKPILHASVAKFLEENHSALPSDRIQFTLAHHYNISCQNKDTPQVVLQKCFENNMRAGKSASQKGSFYAAENYFSKAKGILERVDDSSKSKRNDLLRVLLALGDTRTKERQFGQAIQAYRESLSLPQSSDQIVSTKSKLAEVQMIAGLVSESISSVQEALQISGEQHLNSRMYRFLWASAQLIYDGIFRNKNQHFGRIWNLIDSLGSRLKAQQDQTKKPEHDDGIATTYLIGSTSFGYDHAKTSFVALAHAIRHASRHNVSAQLSVKLIAMWAGKLALHGFFKASFRYFDWVGAFTRKSKLKELYGIVVLYRALTVDYLRGRFDELNDNLKASRRYISRDNDRLHYGYALLLSSYVELIRCEVEKSNHFAKQMSDTVPTRSWLSPRATLLMLFASLLRGERDFIQNQGSLYLQRRSEVSARSDDLFALCIRLVVSHTRGDQNGCRSLFTRMIDRLEKDLNLKQTLFPFERELISGFLYIFALAFKEEHRRSVIRSQETPRFAKAIGSFLGKELRESPVSLLYEAMRSKQPGKPEAERKYLDRALRNSKTSSNDLWQLITSFVFGTHFLENKMTSKKDFLIRALNKAQNYQFHALVDIITKRLDEFGIRASSIAETNESGILDPKLALDRSYSSLVLDHLRSTSSRISNQAYDVSQWILPTLELTSQYFKGTETYFIFQSEEALASKAIGMQPLPADRIAALSQFVSPYFNMRSTLLLPTTQVPWSPDHQGSTNQSIFQTQENTRSTAAVQTGTEQDGTLVLHVERPISNVQHTVMNQSIEESFVEPIFNFSAIVPVRSSNGTEGILFVENVGDLSNQSTTSIREELNMIGCQLGILLERHANHQTFAGQSGSDSTSQPDPFIYHDAKVHIETHPKLDTQFAGRLRSGRESTWYLGLNLNADQQLFCYCNVKGIGEIRDQISKNLWYFVLSLRTWFHSKGRERSDVAEFKEVLSKFLRSQGAHLEIDELMLSVSILDTAERSISSIHFGSARPFVIGSENFVKANNDVIIRLSQNRDLRYWEVKSDLDLGHVLVVSYDTSKLESIMRDRTSQSEWVEEQKHTLLTDGDLFAPLQLPWLKDGLPRYYVAVVLKPENNQVVVSTGSRKVS